MDGGSEFVNDIVTELTKLLLGVPTGVITAYSKEEHAIVERSNKEVMRHLRAMVFAVKEKKQWPIYLPLAQRIINSEIHSSTGVSPNNLMFGGRIDLDCGFFLPFPVPNTGDVPLSQWSADLIAAQKRFIEVAALRQEKKDDVHKAKRSRNQITEFAPNSYVLVAYPDGRMGKKPPSKLHTVWKGPMRVVSYVGSDYVLLDLVENKEKSNIHVSRLKQFEYDIATVNPVDIAVTDAGEHHVEAIVSHVWGDPQKKRKSSLDFEVKWTGYDDPGDNDFLPWSSLRLLPVLHEYLRANGMGRLIPKEFQ
jgi:hypothetical protein